MNKFYILIAALFFTCSVNAQYYLWGKSFGGEGDESLRAMAVDGEGNVYTTGYFTDNADFDPGEGELELASNGFYDVFVSKVDSDGNLVWALSIGGEFFDYGTGIEVDPDGSILITGVFTETVDFDPGEGIEERTSTGSEDIFALKLDADGQFLWVFTIGSEFYEEPVSIISDGNSNVYVAGYFANPIEFPIGLGGVTINTSGGQDGFAFKLDAFGMPIWAVSFGGMGLDLCLGMDVNASGDVFLTGFYSGIADFDPGEGEALLDAGNDSNAYLLKLNPFGEFVQAIDFGGTDNEIAWDVAVDQNNNAFVAGGFRGNFVAGTTEIPANGLGDDEAFVVKVNPFGEVEWASAMGGEDGYQSAYDVNTDLEGNVVIAGFFDGTVDFDPTEGTYELSKESSEPFDAFVTKLNSEGEFVFAANFGGTNFIEHHGVDTDDQGNIYLASTFQQTVDLNPNPTEEDLQTVQGFRDLYIIKLNHLALGIKDYFNLPTIALYPNPAIDFIQVELDQSARNSSFQIYDELGKLVDNGIINRSSSRIILDGLNSGFYLLHIDGYKPTKFLIP